MLTLTVGVDFVAALCTKRRLRAAGEDDDEEATIADSEGVHTPGLMMPQIRQSALLALIRGALTEGGESMALTRGCRHAGGYIMEGGHAHPQAMMILDKRWLGEDVSLTGAEEAELACRSTWPARLSVEACHAHYAEVMTRAAGMGLTPGDDCFNESDDATNTRRRLWHLLFPPPEGSVFHRAAEEAKRATDGDCSTVAHRVEFCEAMLRAVSKQVEERHIKEVRKELCEVCDSGEHTDHLYCMGSRLAHWIAARVAEVVALANAPDMHIWPCSTCRSSKKRYHSPSCRISRSTE